MSALTEKSDLGRIVHLAVEQGRILRLRVRDLAGNVVWSDDGSGFGDDPEDEALDAAHGETVARLTHLNADSDDEGPTGVAAVEVYLPLVAGDPSRRVGVWRSTSPTRRSPTTSARACTASTSIWASAWPPSTCSCSRSLSR